MNCSNHIMRHVEDVEYRGHEIVIIECDNCRRFIVDARSDNNNGEMLAGFIDKSIYSAISKAQQAIDTHELEKSLTVNVPF